MFALVLNDVRSVSKKDFSFLIHENSGLMFQICRFYSGSVPHIYTALTYAQSLPNLLDFSQSEKDTATVDMLQKLKQFLVNIIERCL